MYIHIYMYTYIFYIYMNFCIHKYIYVHINIGSYLAMDTPTRNLNVPKLLIPKSSVSTDSLNRSLGKSGSSGIGWGLEVSVIILMLTLLLMPLAGLHFCVGLDFVTHSRCNLF
jgi:hypothetical protein